MEAPDPRTRFNTDRLPNWCPGCGNFGMHRALKNALADLGLQPHEVVLVSGIGCSGKIPDWVNVCGLHGLHGRPLPLAEGMKLASPRLVVIAEGGDGDAYSEGMSHFIHAARRNMDLTYIVHNNGVLALTTGQAAATGEQGRRTISTPAGTIESPLLPAALAIIAGATFVARGYCGDLRQLTNVYTAAIKHRGFAFVDVLQVCVTFNPERDYKWYQQRVYNVDEAGHDPNDRDKALSLAVHSDDSGRLATGLFYRTDKPTYENLLPQLKGAPLVEHEIDNVDVGKLMESLF